MAENINNLLHEKLSDPADPIGKDILKIANAQTKILSPRADDFKHHHNHNNHQNHHAAAVKSPSADKRRQRDADNHNHKKPVHTGVRQTQVVKVHPSGADLESHLASKTKTDPNGRRYTYSWTNTSGNLISFINRHCFDCDNNDDHYYFKQPNPLTLSCFQLLISSNRVLETDTTSLLHEFFNRPTRSNRLVFYISCQFILVVFLLSLAIYLYVCIGSFR